MTLSGPVIYDALGRVTEQGRPDFRAGKSIDLVTNLPRKNPTLFAYDALDRTIMVKTPDAKAPGGYAVTTTSYGFDPLPGGTTQYFKTTVIDPEGSLVAGAGNRGTKISYKDVKDRILAVVEFNKVQDPVTKKPAPAQIVTRYEYDALGQILASGTQRVIQRP